jgi:hypothetical protein
MPSGGVSFPAAGMLTDPLTDPLTAPRAFAPMQAFLHGFLPSPLRPEAPGDPHTEARGALPDAFACVVVLRRGRRSKRNQTRSTTGTSIAPLIDVLRVDLTNCRCASVGNAKHRSNASSGVDFHSTRCARLCRGACRRRKTVFRNDGCPRVGQRLNIAGSRHHRFDSGSSLFWNAKRFGTELRIQHVRVRFPLQKAHDLSRHDTPGESPGTPPRAARPSQAEQCTRSTHRNGDAAGLASSGHAGPVETHCATPRPQCR